MSTSPILTAALRRDRWIVAAALALACGLAWLWLFQQAAPGPSGGMAGMGAMAGIAPPPPTFAYWLGAFVMWALMMVAMMLPSAAPMILLYARVAGQSPARPTALAPTFVFAATYLLVWIAFSALATLAQTLLAPSGAISAAKLAFGDNRLAGAVLLVAGAYQLTPLKHACLLQCRSPIGFVMQHWRPGWRGAVTLGLRHAVYCVGCCWALMALLFVGGVMSLPWVALLALIVLAEKAAPIGVIGARVVGVAAALAGVALLAGIAPPHLL